MNFRRFLEFANFGFDNDIKQKPKNELKGDDPAHPLDVGYVVRELKKQTNTRYLSNEFPGEIIWGEGVGSVKMQFSPLGGLKVTMRKLVPDLEGVRRWICKKIIEVRHIYDEKPDLLVETIRTNLNEVDKQGLEAPSNTYEDLEKLVLKLASKLKICRNDLFIYRGIRQTRENIDYSIHFDVQGMGLLQAYGQKRLDEFIVHVYYNRPAGYIKIIGQEVNSPVSQHTWSLDQSEWIEYYMPNQPIEEILESQYLLMKSY